MKKKLGLLLVAGLAFALCFALAGCGVDKSKYVGTWSLESGNDESLDAESIALMKSLGLEVRVVLNEDGSGTMDLFGETKDISWEASSDTEGTMKIDDTTATLALSESKLTVTDPAGNYMEYVKVEASEASPSAASSSAASSSTASATSQDASANAASANDGQQSDELSENADEDVEDGAGAESFDADEDAYGNYADDAAADQDEYGDEGEDGDEQV